MPAVGTHQSLDGGRSIADMLQTTEERVGCVCCSRLSLIYSKTRNEEYEEIFFPKQR